MITMLAPIFGKPRETFKVVKNVEPVETHRILRLATLLFSVSTCLHYGSTPQGAKKSAYSRRVSTVSTVSTLFRFAFSRTCSFFRRTL
jgi:hypothetical protein